MKKKLKKSLACLLATLLIFSAVPMSALADEADTPVSVTVETNAEKAAQDTEPDAEPKPEIHGRADRDAGGKRKALCPNRQQNPHRRQQRNRLNRRSVQSRKQRLNPLLPPRQTRRMESVY